jgi:hypothetical protein
MDAMDNNNNNASASASAAPKKKRGRKVKVEDVPSAAAPVPQTNSNIVADYFVAAVNNGECATDASLVDVAGRELEQHVILRIKQTSAPSTDVVGYSSANAFGNDLQDLPSLNTELCVGKRLRVNNMLNVVRDKPSSSMCFWCSHPLYEGVYGLPVKYKDGNYHSVGCFCSFNCAAAFNFNSRELHQEPWRSYSLLNKMARDAGHKSLVQLAPSRFSLKLFGGWMDIEDFRSHPKLIAPLPTPMVSVTQYLEEIMASDIMIENQNASGTPAFVPLDQDRVQRAKANMIASTATKKSKNSIHAKMNLRVVAPTV